MTFAAPPALIGPEVERHLDWQGLCRALIEGHRLPAPQMQDVLLYRGADTLLNRSAWIDGLGLLVKAATVCPGNAALGQPSVNGAVTLFDDRTGALTALVDFHLVTRWKTAGDSLLSARLLARPDSRNILLIGAGAVARSMVDAYRSAFPEARFTVWSRNPATARALAGPLGLAVAEDLEPAVRAADILCAATLSSRPLIRGAWLQPGQHIDLIGAYTPAMREADDAAMARARVFVDCRATTVSVIGELIEPIRSGALSEAAICGDFYDIAAGLYRRTSAEEITLAKNGGGAHLDLMTAAWIAGIWQARA